MTYFWYSYSLYIVLGILFIIWILYNTWIINTLLAIVFVVYLYESHNSYVANKLCSCFPILRDGHNELRTNNLDDATYSQKYGEVTVNFVTCLGHYINSLYANSIVFIDGTGEYVFNDNYKNIAKLIEENCPMLIREINPVWEQLWEKTTF